MRRFWYRIVLALLLVFAQQQGLLHALQHDFEQLDHKQVPAAPKGPCEQCLSFAGLGHSPPPALPAIFAAPARHEAPAAFLPAGAAAEPSIGYLSRAPPLAS